VPALEGINTHHSIEQCWKLFDVFYLNQEERHQGGIPVNNDNITKPFLCVEFGCKSSTFYSEVGDKLAHKHTAPFSLC
jgi:hypothetical protein